MNFRAFKYLAIFTGPVIGYISLSQLGWWTWALPIYAYVFIPLLEVFIGGNEDNMSEVEEEMTRKDRIYDWLLYIQVPIQYGFLVFFLFAITEPDLTTFEYAGRILTMGIACVSLGINVGHELGHRAKPYERVLAKLLLLSTLYMHFIIEHNRGHHKRIATDEDPASARYGEILYFFMLRSVVFGFISAWKLEASRLKVKGYSFWSWRNEMIRFQFIQAGLLAIIFYYFGWLGMLSFMASATLGFLFLETINYVEHYGLRREKNEDGTYEKILPVHSWNSNHHVGRILLFEISRHSDHHYKSSRKYQVLRHFDEAYQMPTGYPGMIMLSAIPPIWFYVMHRHIAKLQASK
ncbi:MAG: alkane 1-monooxygenase [Flavobacteriales bacterium]|nr:alkane 1-monooxygenase [Flavobacteriales bacterium]